MPKNILKRITKFNKDRDPVLVKLKYKALAENPFRFFRGTCHLFYEDLPKKSFILKSPKAWICGDLHLENFGSFRGDNGLAYFDMNDFDESLLGPALLDIARLSTSVFLAADLLKQSDTECIKAVKILLKAYAQNLSMGYIRFIERKTATGFVGDFLHKVMERDRKEMLSERVISINKEPRIKYDDLKAFEAGMEVKENVKNALGSWAKKHSKNPDFYHVIDIAERATGTGSIGIKRHLVLVKGKGGPQGYYLLDIKQALTPTPLKYLNLKQPKWQNEAERLISIQKRVQAASPAYLNTIQIGKDWFVMKELQPLEDKIDFATLRRDPKRLEQLLTDMGQIVAWNNFRSGGRQGSAIADDLMRYGDKLHKLEDNLVNYAGDYALKTQKYYLDYCNMSKGAFNV
jgi:uncharacterized protein (DUF2252 family)